MNPQLIIAGVLVLGSFGAAWRVQDWRYQAKEAEHAEAKLVKEILIWSKYIMDEVHHTCLTNRSCGKQRSVQFECF